MINLDDMNFQDKITIAQIEEVLEFRKSEFGKVYCFDRCSFEEFKEYVLLLRYRLRASNRDNPSKYQVVSYAKTVKHIKQYDFRFVEVENLLESILAGLECKHEYNNSRQGQKEMYKNRIEWINKSVS